jgi:hypothetical protein
MTASLKSFVRRSAALKLKPFRGIIAAASLKPPPVQASRSHGVRVFCGEHRRSL